MDQELHEVDGDDALGDPGEAIIEVSRSMADSEGKVYLFGYHDTGMQTGDRAKKTKGLRPAARFSQRTPDFVVLVQFVSGPVLAFDGDRDDKTFVLTDGDDDDVPGSTLMTDAEEMGDQDQDKDGYFDGTYVIRPNNATEIVVTATINDAMGNRKCPQEMKIHALISVWCTRRAPTSKPPQPITTPGR